MYLRVESKTSKISRKVAGLGAPKRCVAAAKTPCFSAFFCKPARLVSRRVIARTEQVRNTRQTKVLVPRECFAPKTGQANQAVSQPAKSTRRPRVASSTLRRTKRRVAQTRKHLFEIARGAQASGQNPATSWARDRGLLRAIEGCPFHRARHQRAADKPSPDEAVAGGCLRLRGGASRTTARVETPAIIQLDHSQQVHGLGLPTSTQQNGLCGSVKRPG
jgi:hypothetical protein